MPQVIAPVFWAVEGFLEVDVGLSMATAVTIAEIGTIIVPGIAAAYGASKLLSPKKTPFQMVPNNSLIRNSAANRFLAYGRSSAGGVVVYINQSGSSNQYLDLVFTLATHEIDAIESLVLDNWALTFDGTGTNGGGVCTSETDMRTGVTSTRYAGKVFANFHLGLQGDAADSTLITNSGGQWTSTCTLSGVAYVYLRLTWDQNTFSAGIPNIYAIVRGKKVLDPRTATFVTGSTTSGSATVSVSSTSGLSTGMAFRGAGISPLAKILSIGTGTVTLNANATLSYSNQTYIAGNPAWSQNAAMCVADFMMDQNYGFRVNAGDFDLTYWTTACNDCDVSIGISGGVSEARYTVNGTIDTGRAPGETLDNMLGAMAGLCPWVGGKWYMRAGTYQTPTITLTDSDLRGAPTLSTKVSRRDTINTVKGTYCEPTAQYNATDFTPVADATYLAADLNTRYINDVTFPFTTSHATAQRIAKSILRRSRYGQTVLTMPCKLTAMQAQVGDNVNITLSRFGYVNQPFEVVGFTFAHYADSNNSPALGIDLVLKGTNSAVFDWANGEDVANASTILSNLPSPYNVPTPTGLTLLSDVSTVAVQADGTIVPRLKVSWTAPSSQYVTSGGSVVIQYKRHVDSNWLDWDKVLGAQTTEYITNIVSGTAYDVRISFLNSASYQSAWQESDNYTVSGIANALSAPSSITATAGVGQQIYVKWTAWTDPTVSFYKVYRSTSSSDPSPTYLGSTLTNLFLDPSPTYGIAYYYYVSTVNTSLVEGSKGVSGSATATKSTLVNTSGPSTPSAPTFASNFTYTATDGTSLASITLNVGALPSGAIIQSVMYRTSGTSQWISGPEDNNTSGVTMTVSDLTTGQSYDFEVRAYNESGVYTESSSLTLTAPTKSTAPSGPALVALYTPSSTYTVPPAYTATQTQLYGAYLTWSADSATDVISYEIGNSSNTSTSPSYVAYTTSNLAIPVYTLSLFPLFYWVRSVNRSGVRSSWIVCSTNMNGVCSLTAGSLSTQSQSSPSMTGVQIGSLGASSIKPIYASYSDVVAYTTTNGTNYEAFTVNISGRGFTSAPTSAVFNINAPNVTCFYNPYVTGSWNTSTSVHFELQGVNGAAIPVGTGLIINFTLTQ